MTRNTQIIILFLASQLTWAVCCVAAAPMFVTTTYLETPLMWLVMLNGLFITTASGFLVIVALFVGMSKKDDLSPKRLDPRFSVAMGATAFLLILQVILSAAHAFMQPDASTITPPSAEDVPMFVVGAVLTDGSEPDETYGFVIAHPEDGRPVMVTVSQQFSTYGGLDRDLSNSEIPEAIDRAIALVADGEPRFVGDVDRAVTLGPPIAFDTDALFASGHGAQDSMSDVLFFEAPGLEKYILPVRVFTGLQQSPQGQKLFVWSDSEGMVTGEFGFDNEDVWTVSLPEHEDVLAGTPVLDWKHEVVGFVTRPDAEADVFPMHLAYDYLGEPPFGR